MAGPRRLLRQPGRLDAGPLGADIASFRLHLAAEGKAARTVQGYTSAVRWFAAGYLLGQAGKTSWEQVAARDIQQWMTQLLDRYSSAYASIQIRALRQFFKWRASVIAGIDLRSMPGVAAAADLSGVRGGRRAWQVFG
jgi:integrase/recombinase XerD